MNTTFSFKAMPISIRVGQVCKQLDDLLDSYNVSNWVYVGAMNPGADKISDKINASRHLSLYDQLKKMSVIYFEGMGRSDDWEELGFFIFGIDGVEAENIARQWGQLSFLAATKGEPIVLLYT